MLVPNESSCQLDIMAGVVPELAHSGSALFDHVQKHLRQLRILVQVDQVRKTIVHFEGHPCFLKISKLLLAISYTVCPQLLKCLLIKAKLKAGKFDKLHQIICSKAKKKNKTQNYLQLFGLLLFANFSVL